MAEPMVRYELRETVDPGDSRRLGDYIRDNRKKRALSDAKDICTQLNKQDAEIEALRAKKDLLILEPGSMIPHDAGELLAEKSTEITRLGDMLTAECDTTAGLHDVVSDLREAMQRTLNCGGCEACCKCYAELKAAYDGES
jgi:hypothetical protein